jgi:hypothetical protein
MKSIRTPLERDVKTLQRQLQLVFENAQHQDAALVGIYKLFIPDWENIKQVEGFPTVGREMWKYICQLFIDFDQQHHPEVFKGGIWLNNGFSSDGNLDPWEISFSQCHFVYS